MGHLSHPSLLIAYLMYTYNLKPGEAGLPFFRPSFFWVYLDPHVRGHWRFGAREYAYRAGLGLALAMVAYIAFFSFSGLDNCTLLCLEWFSEIRHFYSCGDMIHTRVRHV